MGLRATAIVVDNANKMINCRHYLGCMWLSGGSGVGIFRANSLTANHIASVSSGNHHNPAFPVNCSGISGGNPYERIYVSGEGTGSKVIVYVSF